LRRGRTADLVAVEGKNDFYYFAEKLRR
jgi:hypothetical protein